MYGCSVRRIPAYEEGLAGARARALYSANGISSFARADMDLYIVAHERLRQSCYARFSRAASCASTLQPAPPPQQQSDIIGESARSCRSSTAIIVLLFCGRGNPFSTASPLQQPARISTSKSLL